MKLADIKGVGEKVCDALASKGITDIPSLIYTIPQSYAVYQLTNFSFENYFNVEAVLIDQVKIVKLKTSVKVSFTTMIDNLRMEVNLFNAVYLKNILKLGSEIVVCGKYSSEYRSVLADRVFLKKDYKEGIIPLYNIEGVTNANMQRIILIALNQYQVKDSIINDEYFKKYGYPYGKDLFYCIHSPKTIEETEKAKKALKYYELLSFAIKISLIRKNIQQARKEAKKYDINKVKDFITLGVPFEFTSDQKESINSIFKYLKSEVPLNMLLQGDVGSGKTIVAVISAFAVYTAGYQSVIIAPTESLSIQHYNSFKEYLDKFGPKIELLTSSTSSKERTRILSALKNGDIDIIIGTHSLLSDEVEFNNLGFIVCDEQHKFGVEQRRKIREKGNNPDILYMTATPIPRTLAITMFKDMTISTIKTMPLGKGKIITKIYSYKDYLQVLDFVKSEIDDGKQAYFVAPVIDESEESELTSVLRIKNDLETYLKGYKIGLLHGKMNSIEKEKVVSEFMKHEIDILVSTTVIEVGINNKNATVMVVIDAMQFGLSQLHQIRGRVGRGKDDGYCFLMVNKVEYPSRLSILEESHDGFLISEEDLRQRGPGDFLGQEQKGQLKFRFADLRYDMNIFKLALNDADELMEKDPKIISFYQNYLSSDFFD